jgi:chemotaxis methyl-accepting protein methylase
MPETERALGLVLELAGKDLSPYKERVIFRALRARALETGRLGVAQYLDSLEAGNDWARSEALRLATTLCPKVSGFFRDPEAFSALEAFAYPAVFRRRSGGPVRVWSAACSRGQEAYSLAISLRRWVRESSPGAAFGVLGTDLDEESLAAARAGVYTARDIESAPAWVREEAFEPLPGGRLGLRPEIRALTQFRQEDLLEVGRRAKGFDLISCRNLLIYLRRPVQESLILNLREALSPGGFLLLGVTETVLGTPWTAFEHVNPRWRIYRKPRGAGG